MSSAGSTVRRDALDIVGARELAERIYADEVGDEKSSTEEAVATVKRVHQKLGRAISPMIGEFGFMAMVHRTVQKARPAHRCLERVLELKEDALLEGMVTCLRDEEPASIRSIGVTLLGGFLTLLSTFIGSDLALRLLLSTWPEAVARAIDSVEKS